MAVKRTKKAGTSAGKGKKEPDILERFHEPVRAWFRSSFEGPTRAQQLGWAQIAGGHSTLLLAPTGSGKTLAAFLASLDRIMFSPEPAKEDRLTVVYVSPLKALGVDIERNLRAPIVGIAAAAERLGIPYRTPEIAVRTGDTPQRERARFRRTPPDILITTPESLYLILTSEARARLTSVDTVIIDEIHAVAATKRGTHLMLSLERMEHMRGDADSLQRVGLSATQRPLDVIARLLGGFKDGKPRPVEIADAGVKRAFDIQIEVPVEDMARLGQDAPALALGQPKKETSEPDHDDDDDDDDDDEPDHDDEPIRTGPASMGNNPPPTPSIWPSIYPRLVELIRAHRSTMIFVNSRRLAERLAGALNEAAEEELALAHHGSVAHERRAYVEDRLKSGTLPAIVATSSLELGIDMGAVDLVIQIEAPPSVASGVQRIGRAGHHVGAVSRGVIFPKYRGDLLACAAAQQRMVNGFVEETRYPHNPLDVLAQHIVAFVSVDAGESGVGVDTLYDLVRQAAPFAELPRSSFDGVLDMLSGRYPSDEFAELRPRITWDRIGGTLASRKGARSIAVVNGGTIPDRGLYGVFFAAEEGKNVRVGELDEEMVFESRAGDVFTLGASSWRIEDISHDKVMVAPAPGEPGKMPFWHGDRPGRPAEFGQAIGELARRLVKQDPAKAAEELCREHALDRRAANNLIQYLVDQRDATGEVPSDKTIIIERFIDELGDWRVCVLSPFGARVHAPWAMAVAAMWAEEKGEELDSIWSDDGIIFRVPEADEPPRSDDFLLDPDLVESLLVRSVGNTALFAARFRENAGRALLLPRKKPGQRSPLWATRKRAADLLAVASKHASFPILLETYRECLRDVFDMPSLTDLLRRLRSRRIRLLTVDAKTPSPFASALLFSYVANFIYDGDAPMAERRAQALSIDHEQLKELLGDAELRELLDIEAIEEVERSLQRLEGWPVKHADAVHDLLLGLGDLSLAELQARCEPADEVAGWVSQLEGRRRIVQVPIAGDARYIAVEDAGRLRDGLGIVPPRGIPQSLLEPVADPLGDLVSRYARTHGPFTSDAVARRLGLGIASVELALRHLEERGRVVQGGFRPGGHGVEWCDSEVLRTIKRKSLARLRKQVEPVEPSTYARFLLRWQGLHKPSGGLDALLNAVESLQGCPIPASTLFSDVLPSRVRGFAPADLDHLCAAGEVLWRGVESVGTSDGRVALYLVDQYHLLAGPPIDTDLSELAVRLRDELAQRGAVFFGDLTRALGGFPRDVLDALWELVWAGYATNDTLSPLRSLGQSDSSKNRTTRPGPRGRGTFRSRRVAPPGSQGRWTLLPTMNQEATTATETQRRTALAQALLERYGIVTREVAHAEGIAGGFSAVYPILKAMEDAGKVRRGYFIAGLGGAQFARPGADDHLRSEREAPDEDAPVVLAACDPANPYGATLPWPEAEPRPGRTAGAHVVLHRGALVGYLGRGERSLITFLPENEPERSQAAHALAEALAGQVDGVLRRALLLSRIDGDAPDRSPLSPILLSAGFSPSRQGYLKRREPEFARR